MKRKAARIWKGEDVNGTTRLAILDGYTCCHQWKSFAVPSLNTFITPPINIVESEKIHNYFLRRILHNVSNTIKTNKGIKIAQKKYGKEDTQGQKRANNPLNPRNIFINKPQRHRI